MSNKVNYRRQGQRRRSENATHYPGPCGGSKRVKAQGRRRWKRRANRSVRRNGYLSAKVCGACHSHRGRPKPNWKPEVTDE